jgi:hypothetical protein
MDFGCGHVVYKPVIDDVERVLINPKPKITCLYIHYRSSKFLENMVDAVNNGICGIAGTFFSVEKSYIDKLYTTFQSIFYEMLSKQIGHNEEQVLTYIYDRYPELFTLYYGDYYSVITNYHNPVRDWHTIRWCFIDQAIIYNRLDLAKDASNKVYESVMLGIIKDMPEEDILYLKDIIDR